MSTARLDLIGKHAAKRGVTYRLILDFKQANGQPVDLTGCSAIAQIRRKPSDAQALDWDIEIDLNTTGRIELSLPGSQTSSQNFPAGRYLWDMVITFADETQQVPVGGTIDLEETISRV